MSSQNFQNFEGSRLNSPSGPHSDFSPQPISGSDSTGSIGTRPAINYLQNYLSDRSLTGTPSSLDDSSNERNNGRRSLVPSRGDNISQAQAAINSNPHVFVDLLSSKLTLDASQIGDLHSLVNVSAVISLFSLDFRFSLSDGHEV